jgi:hypothetical protein
MPTILDTRNGLGYTVQYTIQYEHQRQVGSTDSVPNFIFFSKVPWLIKKTTYNYIAEASFWEKKLKDVVSTYRNYANTQTGKVIESVNAGSKLVIDSQLHYAGSYTETDYFSQPSGLSLPYNVFESSSGSISPQGYWDGSPANGAAMFSTKFYSETGTKTYTDSEPKETVGGRSTIAGVSGFVTSINMSNPRRINNILVYDISTTVTGDIAQTYDP